MGIFRAAVARTGGRARAICPHCLAWRKGNQLPDVVRVPLETEPGDDARWDRNEEPDCKTGVPVNPREQWAIVGDREVDRENQRIVEEVKFVGNFEETPANHDVKKREEDVILRYWPGVKLVERGAAPPMGNT